MSWHPNMFNGPSASTSGSEVVLNQETSFYFSNNDVYQQPAAYYSTAAVNGLYTPLSQPAMDEPQIQELITPLEGLTAQELGRGFNIDAYNHQFHMSNAGLPEQSQYVMDNMFPQLPPSQNWTWNSVWAQDLPTAPSSPDFLPIQGTAETSPLDLNVGLKRTKQDGEELVAMGLYDSPAEIQSSSMLFGGPPKKSLKLEESFEPAPEDTNNDDDGEEDTVADADDGEDEASQNNIDSTGGAIYATGQNESVNMAGQSFFFDRDSQHAVYPPALNTMMGFQANTGMSYCWF
jgi:hypothetical protein